MLYLLNLYIIDHLIGHVNTGKVYYNYKSNFLILNHSIISIMDYNKIF